MEEENDEKGSPPGIKYLERKYLHAISIALERAGEYGLEAEVIATALACISEGSTLKEALVAGLTDWDLLESSEHLGDDPFKML